jgi:hypothetical protein
MEHAQRRISTAAYRTGRLFQRVLEGGRLGGLAKLTWRPRVDAAPCAELVIINGLSSAKRRMELETFLVQQVGRIGAAFLRRILVDGSTYAQIAGAAGRGSVREVSFVAKRFRTCLQELAVALQQDPSILNSKGDELDR